jgi:hypothetical protein
MKKRLIGITSLVLTLALVVGGCDLFGSDDGIDFSAPDIGRASDLQATGGTAPADDAEAKALFDGAVEAVGAAMMDSQGARSMTAARATETIPTETISWTGSYGGGTVNVQGTMGGSFTFPDENFEFIANHTYNDIIKMSMNLDVSGTVTGITIEDPDNTAVTYTITGKLINDLDFEVSVDFTTGATENEDPTAADMDLSFAHRAGYALSIKRNDGVGAKFLISYAHQFSKQDIDILNVLLAGPAPDLGTAAELTGKTATLQVYDDANNLLSEQTLPVSEIPGGMMDMMGMLGGA